MQTIDSHIRGGVGGIEEDVDAGEKERHVCKTQYLLNNTELSDANSGRLSCASHCLWICPNGQPTRVKEKGLIEGGKVLVGHFAVVTGRIQLTVSPVPVVVV